LGNLFETVTKTVEAQRSADLHERTPALPNPTIKRRNFGQINLTSNSSLISYLQWRRSSPS